MKLTTIYRRYAVYTLLAVSILGSVTHYYVFRYSIHLSTDDVLQEYRQCVIDYALEKDTLISLQQLEMKHSRISFTEIEKELDGEQAISDSIIYSHHQKEKVVYRVLNFDVKANGILYKVTLSQSTLEEDDLIFAIIISLSLLVLFFMVASFLVSNYIRLLWRPFDKLLAYLRRYKIDRRNISPPSHSGIDEFDEMNGAVYKMIIQIHNDYKSLKEFTEDTSHELQTPLSIIKAKLELLQQMELDNVKSAKLIQSMQSAVTRISNFNCTLLLIAKINNDQFLETEKVDIIKLFEEYLSACEDVIANRKITIHRQNSVQFIVQMNQILADRLVMNILSNALRYNVEGGYLSFFVSENELCVHNTYNNLLPEGDLFGRFVKTTQESEATGLGLTIVKDICGKSLLEVELQITKSKFGIILRKK